MNLRAYLVTLCAAISALSVIPTTHAATVQLDDGTFIGTTSDGVNNFLGIPFAQPPCVTSLWRYYLSSSTDLAHISPTNSVGDLRFRLPQEFGPYDGTHNASEFGPACPQQAIPPVNTTDLPKEVADYLQSLISSGNIQDSEDCAEIIYLSQIEYLTASAPCRFNA
jgi:acetylcholinesterase